MAGLWLRRQCKSLGLLAMCVLGLACQQSDTSLCGATICPANTVCVDDPDLLCVLPEQLEACATRNDGEDCNFVGENVGYCLRGICRIAACDNGLLEPGEMCDDGDPESTATCSEECDTDYTCGNGFIDTQEGEVCDDGNLRSGDSCSSTCSLETSSWLSFKTLLPGFSRTETALVYMANRDRMVLFGGLSDDIGINPETWEFDGLRWERSDTLHAPSARRLHHMAYDPGLGKVVLFGGISSNGTIHGDTWLYDGLDWELLATATEPGARYQHKMVYDAREGQVMMQGGRDSDLVLGAETWFFDGQDWNAGPASGMPALRDFGLAYDPIREEVVLYGGTAAAGPNALFLWKYDETGWRDLTAAVSAPLGVPTRREQHCLVFDHNRGQIVAYGGKSGSNPMANPLAYSGAESGQAWSVITTPSPPPEGFDVPCAFSTVSEELVVIVRESSNVVLPTTPTAVTPVETWSLSADDWSRIRRIHSAPRSELGMMSAYDSKADRLRMFGGREVLSDDRELVFSQTWDYDGFQWRFQESPTTPIARHGGAMAYDEARDRMVLFGGQARTGEQLGDTWELVDSNWIEIESEASPSPRSGHAAAYLVGGGKVVVFGGRDADGTELDDTWLFDGTSWTELSLPDGEHPSARTGAAMSYDPTRGRIVLFGGQFEEAPLGETWEFDNEQWIEIPAPVAPPPRSFHGLTYVRSASMVLLHGGSALRPNGTIAPGASDTWGYVGQSWTPLASVPTTALVSGHLFVDAPKGPLVFGGTGHTDDVRAYRHEFLSFLDQELCSSEIDEDGDGLVSCDDVDCSLKSCGPNQTVCVDSSCVCLEGDEETSCVDGLDNDCDGRIDCEDDDGCALTSDCAPEPLCADGTDDDGDGHTDCADPGCRGLAPCEVEEVSCSDAFDNDGDGQVDCDDFNCSLDSNC